MLNFNSILVFSENPKALADFYGKVFQKKADWNDSNYYGFSVGSAFLTIGPHDKVKGKNKSPERIMINLETKEVKEEFERIKKIGAKVIAAPYSMGDDESNGLIATFADPDGNFFQLLTPWEGK
ncbi:hypothetical protein A3G67_02650 [Candidatus Roizmanbacteria bacterium RIFCSPLOWO2_12_FULL_40_12]|uniref:VOC domain-containing protein n=1 Tax=Candidatus Roizmanbacteria bacterium RIFCSPLOWO2_01_FULL_40_42 TaxID=1802066 RepID=A0A1F7J626_9BACT|nr:MAG: hypothetical protein A2779_03940 [Candidatus Roizmanbacteria bacterium RIFCSPHIGHO2_01_FULL_40_98]OGK28651.1 MAG: hypothetical protein A3C31_01500 [Candidatus Roizmanbacteria bacterium RIFCSPHIGHO2_02_FULL_40_53]OGK29433.1 MAG: hypothetical protein A2W49_04270 [Candidatus Roizmanbacteria bacterium RIFCSPHIGHO2_12_41_18]OGK36635.1 MAG: hypothetical protein A3E69_00170 [Candidatus Roizmanbacteria bacterium RIFCSPHIGHO2_12_FULL_40_130]OGK51074.1 MAG: hypothetical protein A3B50_02825 [Candi